MSELFFFQKINNKIILPEDETHHCIKVCRHSVGDTIEITDGKGNLFQAIIKNYSKKYTEVEITKTIYENYSPKYRVGILLPILHIRERMEFMLEKLTELGITDIYPTVYERCQRKKIKTERINKLLKSAIKQSKRPLLPTLHKLNSLEKHNISVFTTRIAPTMEAEKTKLPELTKNIIFAIGPEGGFTEKELKWFGENNFHLISLSEFRLRAETAAIYTLAIINYNI